jgi:hypothetical protein
VEFALGNPAGGLTVEEEVGREGDRPEAVPETPLTPGSAISERAVRDRLAYPHLRQQVSERTRTVTDGLCGCTGRTAISPDLRFEVKEMGEIDMVSMALVAAIDTELLEPPPLATALPATVVQRRHECGADGRLAGALRELIG